MIKQTKNPDWMEKTKPRNTINQTNPGSNPITPDWMENTIPSSAQWDSSEAILNQWKHLQLPAS